VVQSWYRLIGSHKDYICRFSENCRSKEVTPTIVETTVVETTIVEAIIKTIIITLIIAGIQTFIIDMLIMVMDGLFQENTSQQTTTDT